jgi:hypothetical protein
VVYDNGKVLKYSHLHIEDEFGGLAEQGLDLTDEGYTPLSKNDFFMLWNKPIIETFTAKKVHLSGWHIGVYNKEINSYKTQLKADETLISATLDHRFTLDLSFENREEHFPKTGFFLLKINEGHTGIHYFIYMNWDEAATATQQFIDEINEANKTVDVKKIEEEKAFQVRLSIDNQIVMSKLTTWRNMDWDVEKFRNIQIEVRDETYSIIDTFTDFENMLLALQKSMPKNYKIETCFFCRFSSYSVAGNDNFGTLICLKDYKDKFLKVKNKDDFIGFQSEMNAFILVEETHYCSEFQLIHGSDWAFKNQIKN